MKCNSCLCCFVLLLVIVQSKDAKKEDIWEQDLSDSFKIDYSTQGLQKVNLKCGSSSMDVELITEDEFTGVMYTRGSFHQQTEPCFVKPSGKSKSARKLHMNFPFSKCQTQQDGDLYTNVVVVQHDPDLVTPGDAAFTLECDFRKARSIDVSAKIQTRDRQASGSRITITSPDPSVAPQQHSDNSAYNDTDTVSFVPADKHLPRKLVVAGSVETVQMKHRKKAVDEL